LAVWDRDLWLVRAVHRLRPVLGATGLSLPEQVTVTAGRTRLPVGDSSHPLGECWPSRTRDDRVPHIVINDSITDELTILSVLVHELVHASDDCRSGHGPWFRGWARAVGLEGPFPSTHAGLRLQRQLRSIARGLGRYPDARHGYCMSKTGSLLS
jgi:hypothetical protein